MEQILYAINGINYVLVEEVVLDTNEKAIQKAVLELNCIIQSVKLVKGSWSYKTYGEAKILVPEASIHEYQKLKSINK